MRAHTAFSALRRTCAAAMLALPALALAAYPEKPITIIVPFAAGGTADIFGRMLSAGLAQKFPSATFIVENRAGAGGTIGTARVVRAASQTPIIAPATPTPGAMTYTHTQAPAAASGKYNNLFYIFENGALAEASRVALEITATYDADGNASTTADRMEVIYTVPLTGKAGGEIARNGYYRVAANITGLVGQDCQVSVSVAEWETPVTQSVDLGA